MEKIRIGIFGFGRGSSFVESIRANGGELVAICDKNPRRCADALEKYGAGVAFYEDFDAFIEHPMDAVLLANYFHEHAPYAIRCLEKGIHVLSECTAAGTMAESVALVRAAEKSSAFYMLCENYPFMLFNQEMKRVYETGTLGRVLFAEGEYNHPGAPSNGPLTLFDDMKHWRRFLPRTYYITHSLAPLMYATGSIPRRVTALPIYDPAGASMVGDIAAVVTCLNNDDSVFRVFGHDDGCAGRKDNSRRNFRAAQSQGLGIIVPSPTLAGRISSRIGEIRVGRFGCGRRALVVFGLVFGLVIRRDNVHTISCKCFDGHDGKDHAQHQQPSQSFD